MAVPETLEAPQPAPLKKKVAIVGGGPSRRLAPFGDETWDVWAFSSLRLKTPRVARWFEMHAPGDLATQLTRATPARRSFREYARFLRELKCPIYMQRRLRALPHSVAYPLEAALAAFGRCFTSTVSYMIALAILEGYDVIGVWGVHLTARSVYSRQRPGVEYLLGVARRRGIEVVLPPGSPLRVPEEPVLPYTDVLYGYDWRSAGAWWRQVRRFAAGPRGRPAAGAQGRSAARGQGRPTARAGR